MVAKELTPNPYVEKFRRCLSPDNWSQALPSAWSDGWLRGLARDLRGFDGICARDADPDRPLWIVLCIATGRGRAVGRGLEGRGWELIQRLMTGLRVVVEREIVSRPIGLASPTDATQVIALVDLVIEAQQAENSS